MTPSPSSTPDATWGSVCSRAFAKSRWTSTDRAGNKARVSACGYTLTGVNAEGRNAPAGAYWLNLVLAAMSAEPDRGAMFNLKFAYFAPTAVDCAQVTTVRGQDKGDEDLTLFTPPSQCVPVSNALYSLAESGAYAPASEAEARAGFMLMYFSSTLVKAALVDEDFRLHFVEVLGDSVVTSASELFQVPLEAHEELMPLY